VVLCFVVVVAKSDSKEHAFLFRFKICRVRMLKFVKEDVWEEQSNGTWFRPVVVMLRNYLYTKLPIRVCSVCHNAG
jgi:hypothetical protein